MNTRWNIFTLSEINPHGEDLQIGSVDPAVIEDLYKRLNHDISINPIEKPPMDASLNVGAKVFHSVEPLRMYNHYGVQTYINYQLFESLCGGVFTTCVGSKEYAELAITISDAIEYGMVNRTENPDVFELNTNHIPDDLKSIYSVESLLSIYGGIAVNGGSLCVDYTYTIPLYICVDIIPDPVMIKNATKV
jgi:hypothetical protein